MSRDEAMSNSEKVKPVALLGLKTFVGLTMSKPSFVMLVFRR